MHNYAPIPEFRAGLTERSGVAAKRKLNHPGIILKAEVPSITAPMRLPRVPEPFDNPDFLYELKYDGFRALAYLSATRSRLVSRRGIPCKSFDSVFHEIRAGQHLKRVPICKAL
jgi:ATP-dependent DNA ligase